MPNISFEFNGKKFKAEVEDGFTDLPLETQQKRLYSSLNAKYGLKEKPSKENKNILDYISLIERPIQAAKVGLKETSIGSLVNEALGGVDLTPREGLLTGIKRGWMGTDEVRTQDYLPEDMNPYLKMGIGFVGDVVTDPLTFFGPALVSKAGKGISYASDVTGATPVLKKAGERALKTKIPFADREVSDVLRGLNVPTGRGKEVKGAAFQASYNDLQSRIQKALTEDVEDLENFFVSRARELGVGKENIQAAFKKAMERDALTEEVLDEFKNPIPLLDNEGKPLLRNGEVVNQKKKVGYKDFDAETKRILGDRGIAEAEKFTRLFDDAVGFSQAFGQPIREITSKGYFPRVITKEWRDKLDELKIKDLDDEVDAPVFGQSFKGEREDIARELSFDDAEKLFRDNYTKKYMDEIGGASNPADIPFFETDPIVAIGSRLAAQAKSAQRKWFIDEITDSGYGVGTMFTREMFSDILKQFNRERGTGNAFVKNAETGKREPTPQFVQYVKENTNWKPERNIGLWIKTEKDSAGKTTIFKRELNPQWKGRLDKSNEQYNWTPLDEAEKNRLFRTEDYRQVDGIPAGYISTKMGDDAWLSTFESVIKAEGSRLDPRVFDAVVKSGARTTEEVDGIVESVIPALRSPTLQKSTRESGLNQYRNAVDQANKARDAVLGQSQAKFFAPASIKRQIEDTLSVMSGPSGRANKFINAYDKATNTWKSWSLGVRPAYHTRNAIGNMWNAYMIAGVAPNYDEIVNQAGKLQYYARFGGSEKRRQEIMSNLTGAKGKLLKGAGTKYKSINDREWIAPNFAGTGYSMKEIYEAARARGVSAGHYTSDTVREMQLAMQVRTGQGSAFERYIGPENPFVRTGFAIGGTIEGNARFQIFLHILKDIKKNPSKYEWTAPDGKVFKLNQALPKDYFKTTTALYRDRGINTHVPMTKDDMIMDIAGRKVKEALFDYGDLSAFEQNVLKRGMPFYTWSRKNIPAQFKALLQNPQRAEKLAIAKEQFEHDTGEMSTADYGKFWGDRVPVFLGNENEGIVKAFTMLNLLPMADLQYALDPKRVISELATPLVKAPLEALANYDTFMNRQIKSTPGEMQDFLGVKLPPRLHHFAKLLVPLAELNRLNPANVFGVNELDPKTGLSVNKTDAFYGLGASRESYKDAPQVARWVRFFSGVPVYDVNLDRIEYFDNKNLMRDVAELKGRIKWAARKQENRKLEEYYDLLEAIQLGETRDPFQRRS